ncbi:MAG: APC family permease [Anaerolineales bacterium]|nr:APC family permease [Anaerolineales bacterium]
MVWHTAGFCHHVGCALYRLAGHLCRASRCLCHRFRRRGQLLPNRRRCCQGRRNKPEPPVQPVGYLTGCPHCLTSLQWATYSVQQNGEIKDARSFKNQAFIIVGSLIVTGLLLAVLALALERAVGNEFLYVAGGGYWAGLEEATISGFWLWPNMIAVALSANPLIVLIIGVGYILNSFQIVNNCYIGMTRVMVAMSLDRLLPEWVSRVSEKLHTPVNAHLPIFWPVFRLFWFTTCGISGRR